MKPRTLLVLALVVAGLGAFIWFVDRDLPSSEERAELGKKVFGDLDTGQVQALVLEWGDHKVRLERQPAAESASSSSDSEGESSEPGAVAPTIAAAPGWRLTEPAGIAPAAADGAAVDRLLDTLVGLVKSRTVEGADPAAAGLDPPRAKVTLVTAAGEKAKVGDEGAGAEKVLEIGAEVPASSSTLVRLAGRADAYVVDGGVYADVTKAPGDWRDKRLFTADRDRVRRVTLSGGPAGEPVVLARRGEDFWIESPIVDRADRDHADRLLTDLGSLTAQSFVDHPEGTASDLGLEPPEEVVEVKLAAAAAPGGTSAAAEKSGTEGEAGGAAKPGAAPEGGVGVSEEFRLELGHPVSAGSAVRYARAGGGIVEVQTPLAEAVARPLAQWQATTLTGLRLYQIDRAEVERGATKIALARDGSEWKRNGETISYTPVSEFLYAVTDARADRLVRRSEAVRQGADLATPTLTVTLEPSGGAEPETLSLYPPVAALEGRVPATASGRDFVLLLPADTGDKVRDKLDHLEKAEPVAAQPAAGASSSSSSPAEAADKT